MKTKIIAILIALLSATTYANKPITKSEFTAGFITYLKKHIPEAKVKAKKELSLKVLYKNNGEHSVFLDNAYDTYTSGQRDIELIYRDHIQAIKNQEEVISNEDIQNVFPVIKPGSYVESVKSQIKASGYKGKDIPLYFEKINDDLYLMYVFNSEANMRFVSKEYIEKNGGAEKISSIARKNMTSHYKKSGAQIRQIDTEGNGKIYLFSVDENYEASILALPAYLEDLKAKGDGDVILFTPARNIVLITYSNDITGIQIALNIAQQAYNEMGHAISPYAYIYKNGKLKRLNIE